MRQTIKIAQQKAQADRKERDFLAKLQAIKRIQASCNAFLAAA